MNTRTVRPVVVLAVSCLCIAAAPHPASEIASDDVATMSRGASSPMRSEVRSVDTPPPPGKATISLTGDGVDVTGKYATQLCGGAYIMGEGVSYQVKAGDWRITVASENRASGDVPLNAPDGGVNIVATANGPGRQFVRGPRNGGSVKIGEDFMRADVDLELRAVVGTEKARLVATFVCAGS